MAIELYKSSSRAFRVAFGAAVCALLGLGGCGSDEHGEMPNKDRDAGDEFDAGEVPDVGPPAAAYLTPPENLSEWNLFADEVNQTPGPRTVPYDVIAPLFSDYAAKRRFIYVPEGKSIGYSETDLWTLPEGSVLIKTFSYPRDLRDPAAGERLLETRLLVYTAEGVVPHTYVWNEEQTAATRKVVGTNIAASWIDQSGAQVSNTFTVPNTNQCFDCHGKRGVTNTLGVRTRQLDRSHDFDGSPQNQVDRLSALGFLDRVPEASDQRQRLVDPFGDASVDLRARSYIDANCSQCHKQGGDASASGMWLDWPNTGPETNPTYWGVCKRPTSAGGATCGNEVDIVPGDPDHSIYLCRLESTDPKVQMPPLGRNMVHEEGVALIREWITLLQGSCQ
ncbi:MAG: SO2930 family diheme c-type cytochrome [Myxococcales bacterium]